MTDKLYSNGFVACASGQTMLPKFMVIWVERMSTKVTIYWANSYAHLFFASHKLKTIPLTHSGAESIQKLHQVTVAERNTTTYLTGLQPIYSHLKAGHHTQSDDIHVRTCDQLILSCFTDFQNRIYGYLTNMTRIIFISAVRTLICIFFIHSHARPKQN